MKVRIGAISLIVLSIVGVVIFTTTPIISARERVQGSDASGSWDILVSLKISFLGKGNWVEKGELYGDNYYYEENWGPSVWIYYMKSFPIRITILILVSLVLSIIAGFFSLFCYNEYRKNIGGVLGIISGGLILTGEILFMEWGRWFSGLFSFSFTYRYFSAGFIAPIIIGSLIVIISILFLLVKPKIRKTKNKVHNSHDKDSHAK